MAARARQYGTGSIRKLPSGRFQARFRVDGERYSAPTTFPNRKDAETWLRVQEAALITGTWKPTVKAKPTELPTLGEYGDAWIAGRRSKSGRPLSPATIRTYRGLLALMEDLEDLPLDRLTPAAVRTWFNDLDPDHAARNHDAFALLRSMMTTATEDELIPVNPCKHRYSAPAKAHRTVVATLDELAVIAENVPPHHRAAVLLSAWCAVRFGELTELRRKDIDLRAGTVDISRAVTRAGGGEYVVKTPKTDSGIRTVAIPPHIIEDIRQHLNTYVGKHADALLFPAADGESHIAPSTLYGSIRKQHGFHWARHLAGRDNLRWQDLRHTGATYAARAGATTRELMQRLGHSTPTMSLWYQHADAERDLELAKKLSKLAKS